MTQHLNESQHIMEIRQAASEAASMVAQAAAESARTVASAAATAITNIAASSAKDHDLLIQLDTKVSIVIGQIENMENTTGKRIDHVEISKLDVVTFNEFKITTTASLTSLDHGVQKLFEEHKKLFQAGEMEQNSRMNKMGTDIDELKRFMWRAAGALGIITVAAPFVFKLFNL